MNSKSLYGSLTQQTLADTISCVGIGLHSGRKTSITVHPASENTGINFVRKDAKPGTGFISGRWYNVTGTACGTTLSNEHSVSIRTVEHLMAALRGCSIDNALIEVDGPEIPIMDGSAMPFIETLHNTGNVQQGVARNIMWIHRPIEYRSGDKYALLMPESRTRFTVQIEFDNPRIGTQVSSFDFDGDDFRNYIAPARTFGLSEQLSLLKKLDLIKGASLSNSILVDGEQIVNKGGLRFDDEFVRHKILDCIGDFGLLGIQILGHYYAKKPGHWLNHQFIRKLFNCRDAWSYITLEEYCDLMGINTNSKADEPQRTNPVCTAKDS